MKKKRLEEYAFFSRQFRERIKDADAPSFLSEQFKQNEIASNRTVAHTTLVFAIICLLFSVIPQIQEVRTLRVLNVQIFAPLSLATLVVHYIVRKSGYAASWVKYALMIEVTVVSMLYFFLFTTYLSYMILFPIVLASRYFDKKLLLQVSLLSFILFILSVHLNIVLEHRSPLFLELHVNSSYNAWCTRSEATLFYGIPMALALGFVSAHSINLTRSGNKLIVSKAASLSLSASVEAELKMAAEIQSSVLPARSYTCPNGNFSVVSSELPAKEVCGDFFDHFMVREHYLVTLVADVSDKGAAAAMYMMSSKKAIQCALECCPDLEQAISLANRLICLDNKSGMFLTMWLGIIDTRTGRGTYINAGHPFPIIRRSNSEISYIENEPDLFIGNFPDINPVVHSFRMYPGDTLLLYTDGLTDAENSSSKSFGLQRALNAVSIYGSSGKRLVEGILKEVRYFCGDRDMFDDITLLSLSCSGLIPPVELSFDEPADTSGTERIVSGLDRILRDLSCPDEKRRNIGVITDEICANIAEYAYEGSDGRIGVQAVINYGEASVVFTDSGIEFNPMEYEDPVFSDEISLGGLGIFLSKNLADEMYYQRCEGKNILTVKVFWN